MMDADEFENLTIIEQIRQLFGYLKEHETVIDDHIDRIYDLEKRLDHIEERFQRDEL